MSRDQTDISRSYVWTVRNAKSGRYVVVLDTAALKNKTVISEISDPAKDSARTLSILETRAQRLKNA